MDAVLQQQIMDQFRKENEALLEHLEQRKLKSLEDTKVTWFLEITGLFNCTIDAYHLRVGPRLLVIKAKHNDTCRRTIQTENGIDTDFYLLGKT